MNIKATTWLAHGNPTRKQDCVSWNQLKTYYNKRQKNPTKPANNHALFTMCDQQIIQKKIDESIVVWLFQKIDNFSKMETQEIIRTMGIIQDAKNKCGMTGVIKVIEYPFSSPPSLIEWKRIFSYLTYINDVQAFNQWFESYTKNNPSKSPSYFLESLRVSKQSNISFLDTVISITPIKKEMDISAERIYNQLLTGDYPIDANELETIKKDYYDILNIVNSQMPIDSPKTKIEQLATVYNAVQSVFNIRPYPIQLISVLSIIVHPSSVKGRLAQIKTGEGKSLIVAMLSAFWAMQQQCVDIITSSQSLAIRDQEKYASFYQELGLSSSHICVKEPNTHHFCAPIVYGTNTDFEFSILREKLYDNPARNHRRMDVAIVDEVDNFLMDKGLQSARIAVPAIQTYQDIKYSIHQYVATNMHMSIESFLKQENKLDANIIDQLPTYYLAQWVTSAKQAQLKNENVDYVIKGDQVIIIDENTGELQHGSRWQHGLHEFVEIKHNIIPQKASLTGASISHPAFFDHYRHIFGLTGTLGSAEERKEITAIYHLDTINIPTRCVSQQKEYPFYYGPHEKYYETILSDVRRMIQENRPTLILVRNINDSLLLSQYFNQTNIHHQCLNGVQRTPDALVVSRAGHQKMVTIATNLAGRGTDIILPNHVKKSGGLHVIVAFYPPNSRVEDQAIGRSARQGDLGSYRMILSENDDDIQNLMLTDITKGLLKGILNSNPMAGLIKGLHRTQQYQENTALLQQDLKSRREISIAKLSQQRQHQSKIERDNFQQLSRFCDLFRIWKTTLSEDWCHTFSKKLSKHRIKKINTIQWPIVLDLDHHHRYIQRRLNTTLSQDELTSWLNTFVLTYKTGILTQWAMEYSLPEYTSEHYVFNETASPWKNILLNPDKSIEHYICLWLGIDHN